MWAFKNALTFCFPVHFGEEFCFLLVGGRQLLYRSGENPASPAFTGGGQGTMLGSCTSGCTK